MIPNPLNAYRQVRVKTATQDKLIVMLYDEGLKQLQYAKKELSEQQPDLESVHNAIVKAQDVITELMVSLNFDQGGKIAQNLFHLYMYFNQTLVEANISKNPEGVLHIYELMNELREAWNTIEGTVKQQERDVTSGVNLAG